MSIPQVTYYCRLCNGPVLDPEKAWVQLDGMPRFWLCPDHMGSGSFTLEANGAWVYLPRGTARVVVGYAWRTA